MEGWELWDSRAREGSSNLHSGTSSEPLLDLPPFPSKSLLLLTRRPATTTGSASSSSISAAASWAVQQIVDHYPPIRRQRDSYPLKSEDQRMPRRVLMDDFPQYLPFVNRERQVADCVSHFAKAFTAAYDTESGQHEMMDHRDEEGDDGDDGDDNDDVYGARNPAQEAARKNYKMVIAAGGPGIGQPPPHAPSVQQVRANLRDMLVLTAPCLSVVLCQARRRGPATPSLLLGAPPLHRRTGSSTAVCGTHTDTRPCIASCTRTFTTGKGRTSSVPSLVVCSINFSSTEYTKQARWSG